MTVTETIKEAVGLDGGGAYLDPRKLDSLLLT
jgi:hypothetical protein